MRRGEEETGGGSDGMSAAPATIQVSPELRVQALRSHLFPGPDEEPPLKTYAVLDGASIPDLRDHLQGDPRPEFVCLYRGELEPDMAEVAPYLVQLEPDTPFTNWLLAEGWAGHWGIFARTSANFTALRTHLRRFLMVKDPEGRSLYFRYYDPRVLRTFLPTCTLEEMEILFGPVNCYLCESGDGRVLDRFQIQDHRLQVAHLPSAPAEAGGVK
jgi:hypothetical protein